MVEPWNYTVVLKSPYCILLLEDELNTQLLKQTAVRKFLLLYLTMRALARIPAKSWIALLEASDTED